MTDELVTNPSDEIIKEKRKNARKRQQKSNPIS